MPTVDTAATPSSGWKHVPNDISQRSWHELPDCPPTYTGGPKLFLDIFAGWGGLSRECALAYLAALPPIDTELNDYVRIAVDISDPKILTKVLGWVTAGWVEHVHFGTPCSTYSIARKNDGGPPPFAAGRRPEG